MIPTTYRYTKPLIIVSAIAAVFFTVYLLFGYQTITFPNSVASGVYVNGQFVGSNPTAIKLRPGNYSVQFNSADMGTAQKQVRTWPFVHSSIVPSTQTNMTVAAQSASALGDGTFTFENTKQFNTVWYAGVVQVPSQSYFLVMKFENGQWDNVYLGDGSDSDFKVVVPADIQSYLLSLPNTGVGVHNGN